MMRRQQAASLEAAKRAMADHKATTEFSRYMTADAVLAALDDGDVQLISLRWLLQFAATGQALPRRQALPAAARVSASLVRQWLDAAASNVRAAVLPIIAVSYCWGSPDHPDEGGEQLRLVANILGQQFRDKYCAHFPDMGVFWDWASLYQELGGEPRTSAQLASFQRALRTTMDLWYTHQGIITIFVTEDVTPRGLSLPYTKRGWPTFERCSSELIRPTVSVAITTSASSKFLTDAHVSTKQALWSMCLDAKCIIGQQRAGRCLPVGPEEFAHVLSSKTFTNGADANDVLALYRSLARRVLSGLKQLRLGGEFESEDVWEWGDGARIGAILAETSFLEVLHLAYAPTVELCGVLGVMATLPSGKLHLLRELSLSRPVLGTDDEQQRLASLVARVLGNGALPSLQALILRGVAFGDPGMREIAAALATGVSPSLKYMNMDSEGITGVGMSALMAAASAGTMGNIEDLDFDGNRIGDDGAIALATALRGGHLRSLKSTGLDSNGVGVDGATALGDALATGMAADLGLLNLSGNAPGYEGVVSLLKALPALPRLQNLVFTSTGIGDRAIVAIAASIEAGDAPSLSELALSSTGMCDPGAEALARAISTGGVPCLRVLLVEDNGGVTSASRERLSAACIGYAPRVKELEWDAQVKV